jgi:hypothetical protein
VTELVVTVLAASVAPFALALLSSPRLGPLLNSRIGVNVFVAEFVMWGSPTAPVWPRNLSALHCRCSAGAP